MLAGGLKGHLAAGLESTFALCTGQHVSGWSVQALYYFVFLFFSFPLQELFESSSEYRQTERGGLSCFVVYTISTSAEFKSMQPITPGVTPLCAFKTHHVPTMQSAAAAGSKAASTSLQLGHVNKQ